MSEKKAGFDILDLIGGVSSDVLVVQRLLMTPPEEGKTHERVVQKFLTTLQEKMDFLRLHAKYTVFDLEATRRENDYLRRMLQQVNDDNGSD